jgi:hypothetical protein
VLLVLLALAGCGRNEAAHSGVLDLRASALHGARALEGEWEFYWQRPADGMPDAFLPCAHWRGERLADGRRLPAFGYGTYRLNVRVPKGRGGTRLAVVLEPIDTAYRLSVTTPEGDVIVPPTGVGVFGVDETSHRPAYRRLEVPFVVNGDFRITLEVSNFEIRTGGPWSPPVLADADIASHDGRARRDQDYLILGVLLVMSLHHLGIFVLHRRDRGPLWLFLFTTIVAIRTLVTARFVDEQQAEHWWSLLSRIEYLTFYVGCPMFLLFMTSAFPRDFPRSSLRIVSWVCAPFVVSLIATPAFVFTETLIPFQFLTIVFVVWLLLVMTGATRRSRDVLPRLVLVGMFVLAVTVINDIAHQIIKTPYIVHYGLTGFLIFQSLLVAVLNQRARGQAEAYAHKMETQANEMAVLNDELRRQIGQRSQRLSQMLATLALRGEQAYRLEVGAVLAQRYRIDGLLGEGGMGAVYAAARLVDGKNVALKVIATSGGNDVLARFAREAEAAATVNHPNVVSILDIDVGEQGELFIVMERVVGAALDAHRSRFGDRAWALPLLGQLARALAAIHAAGVVHRDLKPSNVLVDVAGVIKVADFGIAAVRRGDTPAPSFGPEDQERTQPDRPSRPPTPRVDSPELTRTGVILGSPLYMAPEAACGAQHVTSQADLFSFGIIAFEMLSGRRPFDKPIEQMTSFRAPPSLQRLCAELPGNVVELIDRCLAFDPGARPTAEELIEALESRANSPYG